MSRLNTGNNHPLITRNPTYMIINKMVTVHSEDRDITHWPNANEFEITLPEPFLNIQSVKLEQIMLPNNHYQFSNLFQNIVLPMTINGVSNIFIVIREGYYTPQQLAIQITQQITQEGGAITCTYNSINQKFNFESNDPFSRDANIDGYKEVFINKYNSGCNKDYTTNGSSFDHYNEWGLPYNLGFFRTSYNAIETEPNVFEIEAPTVSNLNTHDTIYMELNMFNSLDELKPFPQRTNHLYNNDYNGSVNSAFAKLPVTTVPQEKIILSKSDLIQNTSSISNPPIERLQKLKFKFRYHDGKLVDFKESNLNFTLSFALFSNELIRTTSDQVPYGYGF